MVYNRIKENVFLRNIENALSIDNRRGLILNEKSLKEIYKDYFMKGLMI